MICTKRFDVEMDGLGHVTITDWDASPKRNIYIQGDDASKFWEEAKQADKSIGLVSNALDREARVDNLCAEYLTD